MENVLIPPPLKCQNVKKGEKCVFFLFFLGEKCVNTPSPEKLKCEKGEKFGFFLCEKCVFVEKCESVKKGEKCFFFFFLR